MRKLQMGLNEFVTRKEQEASIAEAQNVEGTKVNNAGKQLCQFQFLNIH